MPIHIVKSPDVVSPQGEVVVVPGDTEFVPYTFNGVGWILGVQCLPDDTGGIVRDFMQVHISDLSGHEHAERLLMFKYALLESELGPRDAITFERAVKGAATIIELSIGHRPYPVTLEEPFEEAA